MAPHPVGRVVVAGIMAPYLPQPSGRLGRVVVAGIMAPHPVGRVVIAGFMAPHLLQQFCVSSPTAGSRQF